MLYCGYKPTTRTCRNTLNSFGNSFSFQERFIKYFSKSLDSKTRKCDNAFVKIALNVEMICDKTVQLFRLHKKTYVDLAIVRPALHWGVFKGRQTLKLKKERIKTP